jgi:hypothetical protein
MLRLHELVSSEFDQYPLHSNSNLNSNFHWLFCMAWRVPLWLNLFIVPPSSNVLLLSANMPQCYYLRPFLFSHLSFLLHSLSFSFTYWNAQCIFIATVFGAHTALWISFSVLSPLTNILFDHLQPIFAFSMQKLDKNSDKKTASLNSFINFYRSIVSFGPTAK